MDVITEKPRPVVPHCGACCGASGPGQGAHAQYRPARSEAVTWPTGPGSSTRRRWQGPARLRDDVPNRRASHATARDQTGPGSSTRRRWRGPARIRDGAWLRRPWTPEGPGRASRSITPSRQARVWRSRGQATAHRCHPRAHQAARPHKHTPPDTRHQTRARNTIPTHNHRHNRKRAGTPRFRPALDTQRLSALRARWHHATGAHRCTTAVRCQ